jgi:hypothetical protein
MNTFNLSNFNSKTKQIIMSRLNYEAKTIKSKIIKEMATKMNEEMTALALKYSIRIEDYLSKYDQVHNVKIILEIPDLPEEE